MPKKKTRNKPKIQRSKWRKFVPWTLLASALVIGAFVIPSNLLNQNQKKTPPKIDSISPTTGHLGQEITFTGSGFTTQEEYQGPKGKRAAGQIAYFPGNFFQVKGRVFGPPTLSPDGKTLKFPELGLSTREVSEKCQPGVTGKLCQIPIQVVNGYGQVSNVVFYQVDLSAIRPLIYSSAYAPDSPTNMNVAAGAQDVEVLKMKVRADAQNDADITVYDMMVQVRNDNLEIDCYNTFGHVKAIEVESGREVGIGALSGPLFAADCWDIFRLDNVVLPPGTEKTLILKMTLKSTAQIGLQFGIGATPYPGGGYIEWVDYPGPQGSGNFITIVAP